MTSNKYGATKVRADGYVFDSRREYQHYIGLKLREKAGDIRGLKVHPRYEIYPAYEHPRTGEKIRAIYYEADFEYIEDGTTIVEDVKGVETAVFKIKRKMFEHQYPGIEFRMVK